MWIFKRKKKITVEEFCNNIFPEYFTLSQFPDLSLLVGKEPWDMYCSTNHEFLVQRDPTFAIVSLPKFSDHMMALRFEVLGIATFIHFNDNYSPKISELTQSYLLEQEKSNIWEMMDIYNSAVAKSTVSGYDPKTPKGRGHITFINSMRIQLMEKWMGIVKNPKHAARAANRFGCKKPWKTLKTHSHLAYALTDQFGGDFNKDAMERIAVIIQGFYEGFMIKIEEVKIVS